MLEIELGSICMKGVKRIVSDYVLENANWYGCFFFMGRTCYFYVLQNEGFFYFFFPFILFYETIESFPYEVECPCVSFGYPELKVY